MASFGCAALNVALAVRVLASWRSLKWDLDSESDALRVDAVKLVWGLLALYFASAATASVIGFIGIAKVRVRPRKSYVTPLTASPSTTEHTQLCSLLPGLLNSRLCIHASVGVHHELRVV